MAISVPQPGNFPGTFPDGPYASDPQSGYMALFKRAYTDLVRLAVQQTESILQDTCINESIRGEVLSFDRYLALTATDLESRKRGQAYGDFIEESGGTVTQSKLQYKVTQTERRLVNPTFVDYAELFDPRDKYALMKAVRPDGQFLKNVTALFNRHKDSTILTAIKAAVTVDATKFGGDTSAKTFAQIDSGGKFFPATVQADIDAAGTGSNAEGSYLYDNVPAFKVLGTAADGFASTLEGNAYMVAAAYSGNWSGTAPGDTTENVLPTKMGVNTLIQARKILHRQNAIQPGDKVFCVLHPNQFYQMMEDADDTRMTSIDFNDGKPLVNGAPMNYMGFEFRVTTEVSEITAGQTTGLLGSVDLSNADPAVISTGNATTSTGHEVYFYTNTAMVYGQADEVVVRMDEIPQRGYCLQLYHQLGLGAFRLDGDKILIKRCID
jgi:hypothetical protein